jgi:uncharacterized DUF497 family protein
LIFTLKIGLYPQVEFEFDPKKSQINKAKHGIDFTLAQDLWLDRNALTVPATNSGEGRFARIAQMNGKMWCAVFTKRQNKVRLISARRAHRREEREYEENNR